MQRTITLAASGQYVERVNGKVFAALEATGEFQVELDKEGLQDMVAGRKITGDKFKRVLIKDTSGAQNTIKFYAGNDDIFVQPPVSAVGATNATIVPDSVSPAQFAKTNASTTTPVALTAAITTFQHATIIAKKSLSGTANTGDVKLGPSATANQQPYILAPGDEITLDAPFGKKWNFQSWYLAVENAGDGVVVIYS